MTNEEIKGILTEASRLFERTLQEAEISISEHEDGFDLIDQAIAALEAEPLAVGLVSKVQLAEYAEGKTRLLVICADSSRGLGIDQPVTIEKRDAT